MSTTAPTKTDIFGVCTAVGRDVGFHPDILRVAFAFGLFASPWIAIGVYAALGAVVALSAWLFPSDTRVTTVDRTMPAAANTDDVAAPLLKAA